MDSMNMKPITVEQFTRLIKEQMEDGDLTPVMGIGKSGIGKTESIFELTKEMGIGFCELRLVTMTETDLLGIPTINQYGRTDWASNNLLPHEERDGKVGILVLDEITSCSSTIRAAAYQLLDSKRALGNYKLPDGWLVVALGNGIDDGGVFNSMEHAFISRCRAWRVEPDLRTWKKWAIKNDTNPTVVAFLSSMPEYLHKMNPDELAQVFPCPRSWISLSKKLNAREKRVGGTLQQDDVDIYAASCVGAEVASMFGAFYQYNKSVIKVEDILEGKADTKFDLKNNEIMYITVQNLVRAISQELKLGKTGFSSYKADAVKRVSNACNWLIAIGNRSLDMAIMAFTDLGQSVPEFADVVLNDEKFDQLCPQFTQFAVDNKIVLGAV